MRMLDLLMASRKLVITGCFLCPERGGGVYGGASVGMFKSEGIE